MENTVLQNPLAIIHLDPNTIEANPWNPNLLPDYLQAKLEAHIQREGFIDPITLRRLPDGTHEILDGEHRWRAAKKLGYKKVPAIVLQGIDDNRARLLTMNLNNIRGMDEPAALAQLLLQLREAHTVDQLVELTVWKQKEIEKLLAYARPPLPPSPVEATPESDHRLLQGDCRKVMRTLPDASVDLVIADPPYGEGIAEWDRFTPATYTQFTTEWATEALRLLRPGGQLYVFGKKPMKAHLQLAIEALGLKLRDEFIWAHQGMIVNDTLPMSIHEAALWFSKGKPGKVHIKCDGLAPLIVASGKKLGGQKWMEDRDRPYAVRVGSVPLRMKTGRAGGQKQGGWAGYEPAKPYERVGLRGSSQKPEMKKDDFGQEWHVSKRPYRLELPNGGHLPNLFYIPKENQGFHLTAKPTALISLLLQISSDPGDMVLDPFMGSGTTNLAAKQLGRKSIGIELNPEYYQVALRRLHETSEDGISQDTP